MMNNLSLSKSFLPAILLISLFMFGCEEDKSTGPAGLNFSGKLFNSTQLGVRGATVTLTPTSGSAKTAQTNNTGEYSLSNVEAGTYSIRFSATGYQDTTFSNVAIQSSIANRVDTLYGSANVSGRVLNSQTGDGLDSAIVSFSFGTDTSRVDLRVQTNSDGEFSLSRVPIGNFICAIRRAGFFTIVFNNIAFGSGIFALNPLIVTQVPPVGSFRITLTWDATPRDLDSHLTGPDSLNNRFHCYYSQPSPSNSFAVLDNDVTTGFGPETITISKFFNGMYRYSVHNFTYQSNIGSDSIRVSGARVLVYDSQGLVKSYTPPSPSTPGNTWRVFELTVNGSTKTFSDNSGATLGYVTVSSSGDIVNFRPGKVSKEPFIDEENL